MKDYEQFKQFYSEELLAELLELEDIRKDFLIKSAITTFVLLIIAALASLYLVKGDIETVSITFGVWVVCAAIWFFVIQRYYRIFRYSFKASIIQPMIRFLGSDLSYSPEGTIDLETFRRAEIFQRFVNEFDGEDLVSGHIGQTKIRFSEFQARYKDEDSELDEDSGHPIIIAVKLLIKLLFNRNVFKGLFFVADFNKSFYGQVLVLPDMAQKLFGRFGQSIQSKNLIRGELMKMDNAEFEKQFAVYGSDQIQARYVLTPAVMDKILQFKKKTGEKICLSFKNSVLYIAVPCKRNLFEPKYFKSLVDYIDTFRYFQDLRLFIGIVEEFNLNTRIWTKE